MERTTAQIPTGGTQPPRQHEVEACRSCGALLAADQRYCLTCGTRRGATRVPVSTLFTAVGASGAPQSAAAAPAAPVAERQSITPTVGAIGALAVVLALVAGLLIGRDNGGQKVPAAAPVTVSVPSGGAAAAPAADATASARSKKSKSSKKKASLTTGGRKGTADKATLNALQNTSGKDYSKKSANLPKTTVLPGKLPPKDHKKAGGGSKAVTIG
jgi:hypothetical protein